MPEDNPLRLIRTILDEELLEIRLLNKCVIGDGEDGI
jgi:hypothetical protein